MQFNGQNVFRLERRNETIIEEDIDILTLDEDDEHAGSVDSELDVRITKLEDSVDDKV